MKAYRVCNNIVVVYRRCIVGGRWLSFYAVRSCRQHAGERSIGYALQARRATGCYYFGGIGDCFARVGVSRQA